MKQMMKNIHETGEWLKNFTEVTIIALKKKPKATKYGHRNTHTINVIAHTANQVAWILRGRTERNIEDVFGEDQFGFRRGKGIRSEIGMLKISELTLDREEGLCFSFTYWHKVFDPLHWIKFMQFLKGTGINWRKRRFNSKLNMDQNVKVWLDQRDSRGVKNGGGNRKGCCLSPVLFNVYSEYLAKEALEGFGGFKTGQLLLAIEETVLQGWTLEDAIEWNLMWRKLR